jgi:hypothetical protein
MKDLSYRSYLLTESGFAGYFGLNRKRTSLHSGFNEAFKVYIHKSTIIRDLVIGIEDMKYMEYEEPTSKIFKKFNK